MKIEIGESLIMSWLRHAKNCQVVQMNWKVSTHAWQYFNEEQIDVIIDSVQQKFLQEYGLDLFKKIVVPVKLFSVDIAFHENGLNYENKEETIARVLKKMVKMTVTILEYFNSTKTDIIFASPKINNSVYNDLTNSVALLNKYINEKWNLNFNIILICNDDFNNKFRKTSSGLSDPIIWYGKGKVVGYLKRDEINVRSEWIDVWKVYTPRANNVGTELNDDNLNTFVGSPETICTKSYLVIGAELDLNETSCNNLSKYFTTKFVRYLHCLTKGSQDSTSKIFKFVPLQDFSNNSDIDWSTSIHKVDKQLYKKYGLSDEEINHIERKIKAM